MLSRLHIENYALIDSLDVEFPESLVIITGQTGAGKSIMLGALSLALGAKADSSVISNGASTCVVEAEFTVGEDNSAVKAIVEDNDLDWDDGHLLIRRQLAATGRSRAFINDIPVTTAILTELSSHLLDIHSQHQTLLLKDKDFQLSLLDHFAGNKALLEQCAAEYAEVLKLRASLRDARESLSHLNAEKEYNQAQFEQLDKAALRDPGELETLEEEHRKLSSLEDIRIAFDEIASLGEPPAGDSGEHISIAGNLRDIVRRLERLSAFVPECGELSSRLESARVEVDDILSELGSMSASLPSDNSALEQLEERMSLLYGLLKKFSCTSISELISRRDEFSRCLVDTDTLSASIEELEKKLSVSLKRYDSICADLSRARKNSCEAFSAAVRDSLHLMELSKSVFSVNLEDDSPSARGTDRVTFLFSSSGTNPVDVARCASGGEMSRIMLSLKALMAKYTQMPTMIFDEIDSGVSGSVADKMGQVICSMGDFMQVFAITHLPQVAVKGKAHLLVSKDDSGEHTSIKKLSDEQRVLEIARMLSGSRLSDEAIANAKSLILENRRSGQSS